MDKLIGFGHLVELQQGQNERTFVLVEPTYNIVMCLLSALDDIENWDWTGYEFSEETKEDIVQTLLGLASWELTTDA